MFTTVPTGDINSDRMQERIADEFERQATELPSGARLVTAMIQAADTAVPHGLGRKPRGRYIVGQSADARVWDGTASITPKSTFTLRASAPVTVTLIFF